jgi:hypothetical protein
MKGVLIEKSKKHGTFLTGNGEFVKGKHKNRGIGEEIEIEKINTNYKKLAMVMVLVIVLVGGYIPYNAMTSAYGYAEIDINPSVELGYNSNMKVIKISANNLEGEDLIKSIDVKLKGMKVDEAVEAVIAYASSIDYNTDTVVVTYTYSDDDELDAKVEEALQSIDDNDGKIEIVEVEKEKFEEIKEQNEKNEEAVPPAVHVLREKIADLDGQLLHMREMNREQIENSENGNKITTMKTNYEEIEKVSELAHIKNMIKKEIQEQKRINKDLEKQDKENNKNKNSEETMNQENEQEQNGNGKALGQNKDKKENTKDESSDVDVTVKKTDQENDEQENSSEDDGNSDDNGSNGDEGNKGSNGN